MWSEFFLNYFYYCKILKLIYVILPDAKTIRRFYQNINIIFSILRASSKASTQITMYERHLFYALVLFISVCAAVPPHAHTTVQLRQRNESRRTRERVARASESETRGAVKKPLMRLMLRGSVLPAVARARSPFSFSLVRARFALGVFLFCHLRDAHPFARLWLSLSGRAVARGWCSHPPPDVLPARLFAVAVRTPTEGGWTKYVFAELPVHPSDTGSQPVVVHKARQCNKNNKKTTTINNCDRWSKKKIRKREENIRRTMDTPPPQGRTPTRAGIYQFFGQRFTQSEGIKIGQSVTRCPRVAWREEGVALRNFAALCFDVLVCSIYTFFYTHILNEHKNAFPLFCLSFFFCFLKW